MQSDLPVTDRLLANRGESIQNADLLRFPSGPRKALQFQRLQAAENGAFQDSRVSERELIECQEGI
jgi:hypothetical protein